MTRGMKGCRTGCWTHSCAATRIRPDLIVLMLAAAGSLVGATEVAAQDAAPGADPRVGLAAGWHDADTAISNVELVASIA